MPDRLPIHYFTGDATHPIADGNKIICHICNDIGAWGRGFVVAISKRWPQPEAEYRKWHAAGEPPFELGAVQLVQVENDIWVANMIGQHDIRRRGKTEDGKPPIRYDAVETALSKVAELAIEKKASVHMPRIGCGLAGGSWDLIESIVDRTVCRRGVAAFVYDLV